MHPELLGHLGSPLPVGTSVPVTVPSAVATGKCPVMAGSTPPVSPEQVLLFSHLPSWKKGAECGFLGRGVLETLCHELRLSLKNGISLSQL